MILASLKETKEIEKLNPLFAQAFQYIRENDFSKKEDGRYDIEGDNLFANIQTLSGKNPKEATIEVHKKYIDIQIPLIGVEQIGWKPAADLLEESIPYDDKQDIAFYVDKPTSIARIYPGQCAIFYPEDGHAPGIGEGLLRKIVIKIKR